MDAKIAAMEDLYITIGSNIRKARRKLEISQLELSRRMKLSRASIANIESGRQRLAIHQVYRLSKSLGIQIPDILPPSSEVPINPAVDLSGLDASERQYVQKIIGK